MIEVNFFKIKKSHCQYLEKFLNTVPVFTKKRLLQYDLKEDQLRGVVARLILKKLLMASGYSENVLKQIKLDKYDRPFIDNKTDFNIAHSGNYVICAISDEGRVGVDIEKIRSIKIDEFNVFLSKKELKEVQSNERPLDLYFELWTKKEAVSKANGKGIGTLIPEIKFKNNIGICENVKWNLTKLAINNKYMAHLAFKGSARIKITELKMKDLLKI